MRVEAVIASVSSFYLLVALHRLRSYYIITDDMPANQTASIEDPLARLS